MNYIFVNNVIVVGRHGVMKHEWSHEQQFSVDIRAQLSTVPGAKSDTLEDTLDYTKLYAIAHEVIEGKSVYLVEKLAEDIAERVLLYEGVVEVMVTIRKPSVLPLGVPGVTIIRNNT